MNLNQLQKQVKELGGLILAKARILVIDDDPSLLEAYKDILQGQSALDQVDPNSFFSSSESVSLQQGFDFTLASQGQEGHQLARQALAEERPYAVAFMDMRMPPGWDGLATAKALRHLDPNIYVVIVSAYSDHSVDDIHNALEYDTLFLRKPFMAEEIYQMARNLTQGWVRDRQLEQQTQRRISLEKRSEYLAYQAGMASEGDVVLRYVADHIERVRVILEQLTSASALAPISQGMEDHMLGLEHDYPGASELQQHLMAMRSLHVQAQELENQTIKQPLHKLQEEVELIAATLAKQHAEFGIHDTASHFNLSELIGDLLTVHTEKLLEYNLIFDQQHEDVGQFYLPRNQVLQAMYHLIVNAVAAITTREEQSDSFNAKSDGKIDIQIEPNASGASVIVADNGIGFTELQLQQQQQAIALREVNAGLDLYSAANFASSVAGDLQVTSTGRKQGAVYILTLPLRSRL